MTKHINKGKQMLKILGLVGMVGLLSYGMADAAGLGAFIDINSIVIVFGGAALFALAVGGSTQSASAALDNLGTGAVYFGWLGFLIGVVAIAQNLDTISDEGGKRHKTGRSSLNRDANCFIWLSNVVGGCASNQEPDAGRLREIVPGARVYPL